MKVSTMMVLLLALVLFAGAGISMVISDRVRNTRGFKNHNPGNIKRGQAWIGLRITQTDPQFDQFIAPEFGIRAIKLLLRKYARPVAQGGYGARTVRQLISIYAPGHENPTDRYIANVAAQLGVSPDAPIDIEQVIPNLVDAIVRQEIGYGEQPYPVAVLTRGLALADDASGAEYASRLPGSLPSASVRWA